MKITDANLLYAVVGGHLQQAFSIKMTCVHDVECSALVAMRGTEFDVTTDCSFGCALAEIQRERAKAPKGPKGPARLRLPTNYDRIIRVRKAPKPDAVQRWLTDHASELESFRGKRVAVHPERGIVASGDTLEAVHKLVSDMGLLDSVDFDMIP